MQSAGLNGWILYMNEHGYDKWIWYILYTRGRNWHVFQTCLLKLSTNLEANSCKSDIMRITLGTKIGLYPFIIIIIIINFIRIESFILDEINYTE